VGVTGWRFVGVKVGIFVGVEVGVATFFLDQSIGIHETKNISVKIYYLARKLWPSQVWAVCGR